jgi:hypothetical protein
LSEEESSLGILLLLKALATQTWELGALPLCRKRVVLEASNQLGVCCFAEELVCNITQLESDKPPSLNKLGLLILVILVQHTFALP